MLIETEVKIGLPDPSALVTKLRQLHAAEVCSVHIVDTYYGLPGGASDSSLRLREIREEEQHVELTVKGRPLDVGNSYAREEITARVLDVAALREILGWLGLSGLARVEKWRQEFLLDGVPVSVDDVAGLGQFVEIGAPVPPQGVDTMRRSIADIARRLDLDTTRRVEESYLQLALLVGPGGDDHRSVGAHEKAR